MDFSANATQTTFRIDMILYRIITLIFFIGTIINCKAQQWVEAFTINSIANPSYSFDNKGNYYVAGEFKLQTHLSPKSEVISNGGSDIVLAKITNSGDILWTKTFGNKNDDYLGGIATDQSGNVVLIGYFVDSIFFKDAQFKSNGFYDGYVLFLDENGEQKWVKSYGTELWECTVNSVPKSSILLDEKTKEITLVLNTPFGLNDYDQKDDTLLCYFDTTSYKVVGETSSYLSLDYSGNLIKKLTVNGSNQLLANFDLKQVSVWAGDILRSGKQEFIAPANVWSNQFIVVNEEDSFRLINQVNFKAAFSNDVATGSLASLVQDSIGNLYFAGTMGCDRVVCGNKFARGPDYLGGNLDGYIGKIDKTGECSWIYAIGGYGRDYFGDIVLRNNNRVVFNGTTSSNAIFYRKDTVDGYFGYNTVILEIDSNGNFVQGEVQGQNGGNFAHKINYTKDDKIVTVGVSKNDTLIFGRLRHYNDKLADAGRIYFAIRNFEPLPKDTAKVSVPALNHKYINIYPNPATNLLTLEGVENLEKHRIQMVDAVGRKVTLHWVSNNQIDIAMIQSGCYFLQIDTGNSIIKATIIKQ